MSESVLEQIIDEAAPRPECHWTADKERTWRYCLSLVKVKARIDGHTLHIRPVNVIEFGNVLNAHGLGHCEITRDCLVHLNTHPAESIRFRH